MVECQLVCKWVSAVGASVWVVMCHLMPMTCCREGGEESATGLQLQSWAGRAMGEAWVWEVVHPPRPLSGCAVNAVQNIPQWRSSASEDAAPPGATALKVGFTAAGCVDEQDGFVWTRGRLRVWAYTLRLCAGLFQGRGALQARLLVCERRWRDRAHTETDRSRFIS